MQKSPASASQSPLREWSVRLGDPVDIALGTLFALFRPIRADEGRQSNLSGDVRPTEGVRPDAAAPLTGWRIYNDLACRELVRRSSG